MPAFNFQRLDLDLLEPNFRLACLDLVAACLARGFSYVATAGYRTYGEQMALWSKGRVIPGPRVTDARGGESAHNFGIAVDFVLDKLPGVQGLQPDWSSEAFRVLVEEVELARLHSGKGYKDLPHVGLPGYVSGADLEPLHRAWTCSKGVDTLSKLKDVWEIIHG